MVQHVKPHVRKRKPVRGYDRRGPLAKRGEKKAYKSLMGLDRLMKSLGLSDEPRPESVAEKGEHMQKRWNGWDNETRREVLYKGGQKYPAVYGTAGKSWGKLTRDERRFIRRAAPDEEEEAYGALESLKELL